MKRSDIRILVVEDDSTLGRAMDQSLKRAGYEAKWVTNAEQAIAAFKLADYELVIIDCMIPKVSGLDLAEQLRRDGGEDFRILLTSGIYKDAQFIKNATFRTKAAGYLLKPFDVAELLKEIETLFGGQLESGRDQLFGLLSQSNVKPEECVERVEALDTIHGFDLTLLYALLMQARVTGTLTVTDPEGQDSEIFFHSGRIVHMNFKDTESYFGVLLVEKGFTSAAEVEEGLALDSRKRIGERLVDINSLSPHAINIVQTEQMAIRLSKILKDTSLKVRLSLDKVDEAPAFIDLQHLRPLLGDWIISKIKVDWLKSLFIPWMESRIVRGPDYDKMPLLRHLPVLMGAPSLMSLLGSPKTIQEILDATREGEDPVYTALYFLLLTRTLRVEASDGGHENFDAKLRRLKRIARDLADKNHFEVLGLSPEARPSEINRAYHDLAKALHPDKLSPKAPADVREMYEKVFRKISEAYDVLKDTAKRESYAKSLELGRAEEALEAETLFEQGKSYLLKGKAREGLAVFEKMKGFKSHRTDFPVYYAWALMKAAVPEQKFEEFMAEIQRLISHVPPEDRHNSHFFFVKGLYHKLVGNRKKALTYFHHAASLDKNFSEAKREFLALRGKKTQTRNTLVGDLTNLFSRKAR